MNIIAKHVMIICCWMIISTAVTGTPIHKIMSQQKNIPYLDSTSGSFHPQRNLLDMYWPAVTENCPVLIFIHGGTWISGSKDMYAALGDNFASKGMVTAIINYRLGDIASYSQMADDCAAAVKWVYENAKRYNGNPNRICISGHSAGGHLAALVTLDQAYFNKLHMVNPVKACLLIDAFGLNMETIIKSPLVTMYRSYIAKVFTNDSLQWKNASPVTHVHQKQVPFYIATGNNSYPFLLSDNEVFIQKLRNLDAKVVVEKIPGKNHAEMIAQLQQSSNMLYNRMISFITDHTQ